ncbi:MAG: hypothetical protein FWD71_21305 [Oscillospiraceae bacterium]|nr:hypothetical protein [Oscillospiraceae bacterium]
MEKEYSKIQDDLLGKDNRIGEINIPEKLDVESLYADELDKNPYFVPTAKYANEHGDDRKIYITIKELQDYVDNSVIMFERDDFVQLYVHYTGIVVVIRTEGSKINPSYDKKGIIGIWDYWSGDFEAVMGGVTAWLQEKLKSM